ncbi:MAG: putative glycolipid-binding domain-containing protein [Gammaproteobacteria bacterium]|jgi:hypothetical protein
MTDDLTITGLWRNRRDGGSEVFALARTEEGTRLAGTVVGWLGPRAGVVDYEVLCDSGWRTRSVSIRSNDYREMIECVLESDGTGTWFREQVEQAQLSGCIDVDIGVTPLTNTLPVRRLRLEVGEACEIVVAWIRFPTLDVVPARQRYTRLAHDRYQYQSLASGFQTEVIVDDDGLVVEYGDIWCRESKAAG